MMEGVEDTLIDMGCSAKSHSFRKVSIMTKLRLRLSTRQQILIVFLLFNLAIFSILFAFAVRA